MSLLRRKLHTLKSDPQPFDEVWEGKKRFEFRLNDREYNEGDFLLLKRTDGKSESLSLLVEVTSILRGPEYGVPPQSVVLSIAPVVEIHPGGLVFACGAKP